MASVLMVPIHLDALQLTTDSLVLAAKADFSRLPYFNGRSEINPDIAFISEDIVTQSYNDRNIVLKSGVHLHWALPDVMTRGRDGRFPGVPNRWMVIRHTEQRFQSTWIIESDYLYPEGQGIRQGSITYPLTDKQKIKLHRSSAANQSPQPYRYMGRKLPFDDWMRDKDQNNEYLPDPLSAIGYGEPGFASFYPNCHSVFGFHDPEATGSIYWEYEVFGWYDNKMNDFLASFKENYQKGKKLPASNEEVRLAIKQQLNWFWIGESNDLPDLVCCYASLKCGNRKESARQSRVDIAVGNNGPEALSALLANRLTTKEYRPKIEDQLEAFLLATKFENKQLDIRPKFEEARHEKESRC
jgi:hypothetical protein